MDAEQSDAQRAVNFFSRILSEKYNREYNSEYCSTQLRQPISITYDEGIGSEVFQDNDDCKPLIYNTYQMYLVKGQSYLQEDIEHSRRQRYRLGIKLVRGAYIRSERQREESTGNTILHGSKLEVDQAYNNVLSSILGLMAKRRSSKIGAIEGTSMYVGASDKDRNRAITHSLFCPGHSGHDNEVNLSLLIATHNAQSVLTAVDCMKELSLPRDFPRVEFAQIYGMADQITYSLSNQGFNVYKLVPFGPFEQLFPWLLRRLEENQVRSSGRLLVVDVRV